jgi:hypothetical protein
MQLAGVEAMSPADLLRRHPLVPLLEHGELLLGAPATPLPTILDRQHGCIHLASYPIIIPVQFSSGAEQPVTAISYGYNHAGNRVLLTDPILQLEYRYDALNRLSFLNDVGGGGDKTFTYDPVSRLTQTSGSGLEFR